MKFQAGKSGNPNGRPRGAKNRTTVAAKEAFQLAFEGVGGVAAFTQWAKDNPSDFFKLYARLLPVEQHLSGKDGGPFDYRNLSEQELDDRIGEYFRRPEAAAFLARIGFKKGEASE